MSGFITDYDIGSTASMIDLSSYNDRGIFSSLASLFTNSVEDLDSVASDPEPEVMRSIQFAKALKVCVYDKHIFSLVISDDDGNIMDSFNTVAFEGLDFKRSVSSGSGRVMVDFKLKQVRTVKVKRTQITNAEKKAIDASIDQQVKANATKNAESGKTGTTKTASGTDSASSASASASSAFDAGASKGEEPKKSYADRAYRYLHTKTEVMSKSNAELEKRVIQAREGGGK